MASAPKPLPGVLGDLVSESTVYGVMLISGMLVIVASDAEAATWDALVKVLVTVGVFWLAHVYSSTVAHLGDDPETEASSKVRLARAASYAVRHSLGMLGTALVPLIILGLGAVGVLGHSVAVWTTLWMDVALLALIGYLGVSGWTEKLWVKLVGAAATALLGVILILLKAFVH
jgi:prepilin signal peptidase PulO-like enzyme (type II secretory pathway)